MNDRILLPETPELRAEAKALAREAWAAMLASPSGRLDGSLPWDDEDAYVRRSWTSGHLALLRDLSRPASMDAAARRLARRVGLEVGATAPDWTEGPRGVSGRALWQLTFGRVTVFFGDSVTYEERRGMGNRAVGAPGITTITDPAAAMVAALAATEPKEPTDG